MIEQSDFREDYGVAESVAAAFAGPARINGVSMDDIKQECRIAQWKTVAAQPSIDLESLREKIRRRARVVVERVRRQVGREADLASAA